jgi:hypothetical protein
LAKKYCKAAGIEPGSSRARGIGIYLLRTTTINDAIHNGAQMDEVKEFAGRHADLRPPELQFVRADVSFVKSRTG